MQLRRRSIGAVRDRSAVGRAPSSC